MTLCRPVFLISRQQSCSAEKDDETQRENDTQKQRKATGREKIRLADQSNVNAPQFSSGREGHVAQATLCPISRTVTSQSYCLTSVSVADLFVGLLILHPRQIPSCLREIKIASENNTKTRKSGNNSNVLPLKAARHDSICNLTLGFKSELQTNPTPFHLESLWGATLMTHRGCSMDWNSDGG